MTPETSDSKQAQLNAAEQEFSRRGYSGAKLNAIADRLGVKQAAIYHHAPGGKQQLHLESLEASFERHRIGIESRTDLADPLDRQLTRLAHWFLAQPPLDLVRIARSDVHDLDPEVSRRVLRRATETFHQPIAEILEASVARGEIRDVDIDFTASMLLTCFDAINGYPKAKGMANDELVDNLVSLTLDGLRPHPRN